MLHSSLWHVCVSCVGIEEEVDLFMCLEGRPTIPFTRHLLRQGSKQDTPSLMTWTDTNKRGWDGWTWLFIKVKGKRNYCDYIIHTSFTNQPFNIVYTALICREEVEHSQCLPKTRPGSTQPEDGGALSNHQDPVWWQPCCGCGIHTEWRKEKGKIYRMLLNVMS